MRLLCSCLSSDIAYLISATNRKSYIALRRKNKATVIFETERFGGTDSAVIIDSARKTPQN